MEHVIEAKNIVFGNLRFLALELPDPWEIAPGVGRPEINATHERGSVRWVVNGDFWYVLFQRELGWAMEVSGRVRPLGRSVPGAGEVVSVGGHPARANWTSRKRGLPWRRHEVRFLKVDFECVSSERRVTLEFSGWCPQEGFREVLEALGKLKCH
ncbi:MAG TPA: hypothetical protein VJ345_02480 [Anaerolineales bacterium]|nr:hypothetical protein [Anaerolineales bacterium]